MDTNYKFFVDYFLQNFDNKKEKNVLDFGCGDGKIVLFMRKEGFNFYGLENNYGEDRGIDTEYIKYYDPPNEKIPFNDNFFDFIYSNQVFEHVKDIDFIVNELFRILKKGGVMIHHFPLESYLIEGHFRIPLIHKFRKCKNRKFITNFFIKLGFGIHRGDLSTNDYNKLVWDFIDNKTFYRSEKEILRAFSKYFISERIDKEKLLYHLRAKGKKFHFIYLIIKILPNTIVNFIEKYRGSITLICYK